jgi:branched-chain amino acid transport system permease protein
MLLFGLALVVMMLFRPAGLWPSTIRRREFSGADDAGAEQARA